MNIIIVGCGRLGSTLAIDLSDEGHNISVIDRDIERLNVLGNGFNGLKIRGIEFDNEVLIDAGIKNADVILMVTPDENINITVSLIAKKIFNVPRIISRIVNPNREYIYEKLEIETINPTRLGAEMLQTRLEIKGVNTIAFLNKDYEIIKKTITKSHNLSKEDIEKKYNCIVSAIFRDENLFIPLKNQVVIKGDMIVCTVSKKDKSKIISSL